MVDESYSMVATHVDQATCDHIINQEYIDFSRLLPKDRILDEEYSGMELVYKAGRTFFTPYIDRDLTTINSFGKWEQAFHVFSAIYTRQYPNRAAELIQYNHLIYTTHFCVGKRICLRSRFSYTFESKSWTHLGVNIATGLGF